MTRSTNKSYPHHLLPSRSLPRSSLSLNSQFFVMDKSLSEEYATIMNSWPRLQDHPLNVFNAVALPHGNFELEIILPPYGSIGALSGIQPLESQTLHKKYADDPAIQRMVFSRDQLNTLSSRMESEEEHERRKKKAEYFVNLKDFEGRLSAFY
ncbi:hypothetical protein K469DRAFT_720259 [Zopfia rhizophila CBS 207.26]|uniref:Uncharacterized protein n=1 Tax=Zopfia rhizophila CBS 207.26 TaxID=1314779 RepID=A0A6A6EHU1_9PEZI|nr:hypothetical protein K469DRAFT_720259 [Zopfia rhizophila CBS 207.26]